MNSPFAWPGGKRALTRTLLSLIPKHEMYVEVFAGSAKLLFAKEPARFEVMNDLNSDVTNFFRVAKHRAAELAERLELEIVHAGRFQELRHSLLPTDGDEIERALRFAYLVWYSFGAKGEHFASASAAHTRMRRSLDTVRDLLHATAQRLYPVLIEQRDFAEILTRYDSAETFFYLDPPYVKFQSNGRYGPLPEEKRAQLFSMLAALKGRFLMSFDDCAEVRSRAREHGMNLRPVRVQYTICGNRGHGEEKAREVLIANFPLK
jgi:DNA adenine methylase